MEIVINVPESLEPYKDDFRWFVETMGRKLHTNRHKGFEKDLVLKDLLGGMHDETYELSEALKETGQFEASIEAVDVANMVFLVAVWLHHAEKPEYDRQRKEL